MNGMRIKNHKPQFNRNQQNGQRRTDRFTRFTPLGAIRLLPPVTDEALATPPSQNAAKKKGKAVAKTAKSAPKLKSRK